MGKLFATLFILLSGMILLSLIQPSMSIGTDHAINYFKRLSKEFAQETDLLKATINKIKPNDSKSIREAKVALMNCRMKYKRIEFFLEYFIPVTARPFNLPPVYEVEEPHMEFQQPRGMQFMEVLLFDDDIESHVSQLKSNAELVNIYANDLYAMLYDLHITDAQIIESLQLELVRIITLGITGFDAPELKTGIRESYEALFSVKEVLQPYLKNVSKARMDSANFFLYQALDYLKESDDFNSFNRLQFLTFTMLPLQRQLKLMSEDMELNVNLKEDVGYQGTINLSANHLFSKNALDICSFPSATENKNEYAFELGHKLFFETALSGNGKRSCATCHNPENYFTDNRATSIAFNDTTFVKRNAPTLLYAAFQHRQFWDAKVNSLEEQVKIVMANPNEMNADFNMIIKRFRKNKGYKELFEKAFPSLNKDSIISIEHIASAIALFERKLAPMNSPFDRYISGDENALTKEQVTGFNLFMGKAQCGTCHFAPLFNGLHPPGYQITELETLGTPKNANFDKPEYDADSGHYLVFPIEYGIRAFKTPTIRNIAMTAPYMHNGAFRTLEEVMDFYNKGGGEGIGLKIKHQTLSSKPLNLSGTEIRAIISFMNSLTDSLPCNIRSKSFN